MRNRHRFLLGFDVVAVLAFVAIGRDTHDQGSTLADVLETAAPFLIALAVAWAASRWEATSITVAGWLFVAGIVVFSGSLYTLVLTGQRWLGAVTPIGGVAFIVGWGLLAWAALRG